MKVKEFLKEIEIANKLNELVGNHKIFLVLDKCHIIRKFDTYNQYLKFIKRTFIDEVVDILKNVEFELDTKYNIPYVDRFGRTMNCEFEFTLESRRF